ncbi:hypothetical protein [Halopiger djelfimassiliensis]|nr:hypothetical protein [Halopiger djelfimassiliensis]
MNAVTHGILETGSELPMDVVGWGVLGLSLLVTVAWLAYLYR